MSLIELNGFERAENGVYHARAERQNFNYSDGEQTEIRLHEILSNTQDLSSNSQELQAQIIDWPTEYHLAVTRANLLRPLNLDGVSRILELGCGCGSISRYLGELDGVQVDSIEGSPSRASLAALRCRDLDNVTIATANFNDIEFPDNYYDLVLFVGVTEYAGRFSERGSDVEALQDLLALGKRTAKEDGVVVVAIENRVGLKYMLGACEDHYALPYVGIENYPESIGIRTYTKSEWKSQMDNAGFVSQAFIYPFPDYKVPTLLIHERAADDYHGEAESTQALLDGLASIRSRDYSAPFELGANESIMWRSVLEAGTLGEHANSFLLLMSNSDKAIEAMSEFSVAQYSSASLAYLTSTGLASTDLVSTELAASNEIENLKDDLLNLQNHADNLQKVVDVMSHSLGWRVLNTLRRLFGKASIK